MYNNNIIIMQSDSSTLKTEAHCTILTNVNTILTNVKRESIFALTISEDSFSIRSGRQSCRIKKKKNEIYFTPGSLYFNHMQDYNHSYCNNNKILL